MTRPPTPTSTLPLPVAATMPPLRILLLHGYTQTPTLFRAKTRALSKHLSRAIPTHDLQLTYLQAPHRLVGADIPGYQHGAFASSSSAEKQQDAQGKGEEEEEPPESYAWWKRNDSVTKDGETVVTYAGLDATFRLVAETILTSGPYDGIVGFSQGAAAAAMVASLLDGAARKEAFDAHRASGGGMAYPSCFLRGQGEQENQEGKREENAFVQPPLKFALCYSGFRAPGRKYAAFYSPRIKTRVLCVMGSVDVVVDEERGMGLVGACEMGEERVVVHPGGHFVPSQRPWLDAVVGFVREGIMEGEGEGQVKRGEKEEEEERVEDMEVPF